MNVMDCTTTNVSMDYYENRLKTFDTYPKQMLLDKFQLARAGLYYTGKSDLCQCFRWHMNISGWEREDDAIKEHYKSAPNCEYIKMVGAPPQRLPGFTFRSSASFGGFGTGSGLFVKPLDAKRFQNSRANAHRDHPM